MARPSNWLAQVVVVTRMNIQTLGQRVGPSLAAIVGIAGVVAVLVGVLSIAQGILRTMTIAGSDDTVIVTRGGASSEMMSFLSQEHARIVKEAPGVLRTDSGPVASAELFVIVNLPKRVTLTDANVPFRGVEPMAFEVRDEIEITSGRMFEWGRNEVIVGRGAANEFEGLDVGSTLTLGKTHWAVVGAFSADGSISESEIWTDVRVLQPAYQRGSSFQSVLAKLTSPEAFKEYKDKLTTDPRLTIQAQRESDYYAAQSSLLYNLVTILGVIVAGLMGLAAVFGALNTMYSAVAARTREIATLRALGFRGGPVVISVLFESLVLAAIGGLMGGTLAYFAFDGFQAATLNWQSFSQIAFAFAVTPGLLINGIVYAMLIGLVGGFFPAIRAARMTIASALREL